MQTVVVQHPRIAPSIGVASAVAALRIEDHDRDVPRVAIPRAEIHLVARFGSMARGGLDMHVMGAREKVIRKTIRAGSRVVMARLHLGSSEAVLGVPASALTGRVVALDVMWGDAEARRLRDRLACARDAHEAATLVNDTIAERAARSNARSPHTQLVVDAAARLRVANVNVVADDLV